MNGVHGSGNGGSSWTDAFISTRVDKARTDRPPALVGTGGLVVLWGHPAPFGVDAVYPFADALTVQLLLHPSIGRGPHGWWVPIPVDTAGYNLPR